MCTVRFHYLVITFGLAGLLLSACGQAAAPASPAVAVQEPWVRAATMMAAMGDEAMADEEEGEMDHGGEGAMADEGEGEMGHGGEGAMGHANGSTSAAYMTLVNNATAPDALVSAATDVAEVVELHTVQMDDGVMRMRPVQQIDVPAGGSVALEPGGFHVMLIGLTQDLNEGDQVTLTLNFQNAGPVEVSAEVRQP